MRLNHRNPKPSQPDAIRTSYFRELQLMLRVARGLVRLRVLPLLPELLDRAAEHRGDSTDSTINHRFDAKQPAEKRVTTKMQQVEQAFWRKFPTERLEKLGRGIAARTSDFQKAQLFRQMREALTTDPLKSSALRARVAAFTAENVALIKSVPQRYLEQVEQIVVGGIRDGQRAVTIASDLVDRFDVAESHAKLIARDQVGKFFGELARVRQEDLGVTRFIWRTAGDNRVREEHEALDGEMFSWDEGAPGEDAFPGDGVQCRCFADPVIDESVDAAQES